MNKTQYDYKEIIRVILILFIFYSFTFNAFAQSITTFKGVVKDSTTQEVIPYATVQFTGTTIGAFTDDDGSFKISNSANNTEVMISFMGYRSKKFSIPIGKTTIKEILLVSQDKTLNDVVIRPQKEKYSKKNNPAVELIKKVIQKKKQNSIDGSDHYKCNEYEQILFALNEFKPNHPQFKNFKFLPNYVVTSAIDDKPILPFSRRETSSEYFYQKDPKIEKRKIKGFNQAGIDKAMDIEGLDVIINETFKDISVYDNSITLLFHEFVSPLSEHRAVSFFRWYIADTIDINGKSYIDLEFIPFNTRDIGFTGNLLITNDSNYAVKKAVLRAPKKMNVNYIDELIIQHDFQEVAPNKWAPMKKTMAMDLSLYNAMKFYVDKSQNFSDFSFTGINDSIYKIEAPLIYEKNYAEKSNEFWLKNRPSDQQMDYKVDEMMDDIMKVKFLKFIVKAGKFIANGGYIHMNKDENKNKLDLGTLLTAYSYNSVEGNRFRLSAKTTTKFHPHFFLYGYGAYGTRDNKLKYYGEATWAFNKNKEHKDEYPKNNITIAYKYDINSLGQRFSQIERDNIFLSLKSSSKDKLTYNRQTEISWMKEYYGGFSYDISAQTYDEKPAGKLRFEKLDNNNNIILENSIRTTEASIQLRYAPKEKFMQYQRRRYPVPTQGSIISLRHTTGLKGVLGGEFNYNKTSLTFENRLWIAQFGKFYLHLQAEKLWGIAPFPILLSPSANSSVTIQKESFYLLEPLEFIHDQQVTLHLEYKLGGLIFNRIPIIKSLKIREVLGFRGVWGNLSDRNDPTRNHKLLIFPDNAFKANKEPYMEYNIGVENIFSIIRIDYVRRINYKNHPDVNKDGFRITGSFSF